MVEINAKRMEVWVVMLQSTLEKEQLMAARPQA